MSVHCVLPNPLHYDQLHVHVQRYDNVPELQNQYYYKINTSSYVLSDPPLP